ncbi:MAG: DUF4145 domain-containing protein [Nitrospirota bacterium]
MAAKITPPSISETAFDCPYCGAFTTQHWLKLHPKSVDEKVRTPHIPDAGLAERIRAYKEMDAEWMADYLDWIEKMRSGLIFVVGANEPIDLYDDVNNLFLSQCYNCKNYAVWVHDRLIHPTAMAGPPPNHDLPPDVLRDYEEAGRIVNESPRGAAALLRLAIQKLCVVLGEKGQKIDDDIANLVKKGLAPMVQQALDAVRVIGNEAVHPGTLDLRDNRDMAMRLFGLVNIIAEQIISNPKHIQELYDKLPENKRKAIEKRDQ